MANFNFDQAEGLRRMLAGPKPRIVTFLSATNGNDKSAMLANLGASLARSGEDVLLMDAIPLARGVALRLGVSHGMSLQNVARSECGLSQAIRKMPQGFGMAVLARESLERHESTDESARLMQAFDMVVKKSGIVLVDGELDREDGLPIPALSREVVMQVASTPTSIKAAYAMIKRLHARTGDSAFSILVTGASETEAKVVYGNLSHVARRYLDLELKSIGSVPADEHLTRAARLGKTVVDAFPMAGASVAFRQLAGRLALPDLPIAAMRSKTVNGTHLGI